MELRRHLFNKHLNSLSLEEQHLLRENKHPSQSHVSFEVAKNYLEAFKRQISNLDCVEKIGLGNYHMDRLVIDVFLKPGTDIAAVRKYIPQFYHGFEVICAIPLKVK